MGRKLKYKTYDEQLEAKRRWRREHYHRNKKEINEARMRRYYKNLKEKDIKRMYEIKSNLNCKFLRYNEYTNELKEY